MKSKNKTVVLAFPKPLDNNNKVYLRKSGKPIKGRSPYLATDAAGHYTAVVFGSDRQIAKSEVYKVFGSTVKFWK